MEFVIKFENLCLRCENELLTSSTLPHNNRTLKNDTKKRLETELSPYNRKNSPGWTILLTRV